MAGQFTRLRALLNVANSYIRVRFFVFSVASTTRLPAKESSPRKPIGKNRRRLRDHQQLVAWPSGSRKMTKIFAKNGIDADLVFMPGSPTLIAAINSGALAVGFTGGTAILAAAAGGADFKVLAASHVRSNHDLVVKPDIKRAEDLRGKGSA